MKVRTKVRTQLRFCSVMAALNPVRPRRRPPPFAQSPKRVA